MGPAMHNRYLSERYLLDVIGMNLLKCLRDRQLTQKKFAALLGVCDDQVSRWITGKNAPSPKMTIEICKVLNVSPGYLWTDHFLAM